MNSLLLLAASAYIPASYPCLHIAFAKREDNPRQRKNRKDHSRVQQRPLMHVCLFVLLSPALPGAWRHVNDRSELYPQ